MAKFRVTERVPCWVTWTYEIEADDADAAYAAYCDGDYGAPICEPDIGESIDYAGDSQIDVTPITTGSGFCRECGAAMFITETGVAHHGAPDEIDYDADADHVALEEGEAQ
jgi:hypothetical protein